MRDERERERERERMGERKRARGDVNLLITPALGALFSFSLYLSLSLSLSQALPPSCNHPLSPLAPLRRIGKVNPSIQSHSAGMLTKIMGAIAAKGGSFASERDGRQTWVEEALRCLMAVYPATFDTVCDVLQTLQIASSTTCPNIMKGTVYENLATSLNVNAKVVLALRLRLLHHWVTTLGMMGFAVTSPDGQRGCIYMSSSMVGSLVRCLCLLCNCVGRAGRMGPRGRGSATDRRAQRRRRRRRRPCVGGAGVRGVAPGRRVAAEQGAGKRGQGGRDV